MNSERFVGSIDVQKFIDYMNSRHPAFSRSAKNGKTYCDIVIWLNAETDEYGNDMSIQLGARKDSREEHKKCYIGNARIPKAQDSKLPVRGVGGVEIPADIPVREKTANTDTEISGGEISDLPF